MGKSINFTSSLEHSIIATAVFHNGKLGLIAVDCYKRKHGWGEFVRNSALRRYIYGSILRSFTMLLLILFNILQTRGKPNDASATSLPLDIWRDQIMTNYANFDEVIPICKSSPQFYQLCRPYAEIKINCGLGNNDVWPPKMLNIKRLNSNKPCLNALQKYSQFYENASITVPETDPLIAVEIIQNLNPKTSITINFPEYNHVSNLQIQWTSINSEKLKAILDSIEGKQERSINIIMRYSA